MSWFMTADTAEFLSVAGEFLRADAARNSVMLTVTADLEAAGPGAGDGADHGGCCSAGSGRRPAR